MKKIILTTLAAMFANVMIAANYTSSNDCLEFIKDQEKCSLTAYWDSDAYSIGYGHHSKDIKESDKISHKTAVAYLKTDIKDAEKYVNHLLKSLPYEYEFSQGFIDGFTSFVYNVGVGNAKKSTFYQRLKKCRVSNGKMNKSDFDFTLSSIKTSCISCKGHVERRKGEYQMMKG